MVIIDSSNRKGVVAAGVVAPTLSGPFGEEEYRHVGRVLVGRETPCFVGFGSPLR